MINTSLTRLEPSDCADKQGDKKLSKDLKRAYEIATEDHDLDFYKEMLQAHEDEMKEFAAEQARKVEAAEEKATKKAEKAEKAAEKADKDSKKKSRKSKGGDDDEMEVDDTEEKKPASKKRKKEADSEGEEPKPKKTPKVKASGKEPTSASAKKPKTKKVVAKPEVDGDDDSGDTQLSEADKLKKRQQTSKSVSRQLVDAC